MTGLGMQWHQLGVVVVAVVVLVPNLLNNLLETCCGYVEICCRFAAGLWYTCC